MDKISNPENSCPVLKKRKYTPETSLLHIFVDYVAAQEPSPRTPEEIIECTETILNGRDFRNMTDFQRIVKYKLNRLLPILLQCNGDVNYTNIHSQTILHIFTDHFIDNRIFPQSDPAKDRKVVEILLERGASVNAVDIWKNTPVHCAASKERTDLVLLMVYTFTEVNTADCYGRTVLHTLVENYKESSNESDLEAIRTLASKGVNPNLKDSFGMSPFEFARDRCFIKVLETFKFDFSNERSFLSILRSADIWPDHYPEQLHHLSRLTVLGKIVKVRDENCGSTPLHYVATFDRIEAVRMFIDAGAEIDAKCIDGITPLHRAVMQGHLEVAKYLIERGANLHARDAIFNFGLMHMATYKNDDSTINFLVERGLDVNDEGGSDFRPLHLAAHVGHDRVIETMISHGVDVDCRTQEERWTPLHLIWLKRKFIPYFDGTSDIFSWVIQYLKKLVPVKDPWDYYGLVSHKASEGRVNCVKLLIQAGANANARDVNFRTPLHLASSDFTNETMTALLKSNARVDVKDGDGKSPLTSVVEHDLSCNGLNVLLRFGADFDELDVNKYFLFISDLRRYLWLLAGIDLPPKQVCRCESSPVVKVWVSFTRKYDDRESAVEKMKAKFLSDGETSLYDFLRMDWRRRGRLAREVLSVDLKSEYPLYHILIENRCRRAINLKLIMNLAASALSRISKFHFPDICTEKILGFLNMSELTGFIDIVDDFHL